jgi:DNA-directed RNA polymerase subunit RPC12/RpoP
MYVCKGCNKEFVDMPKDDECPTCGLVVFKKESVDVDIAPKDPVVAGENGIGIIMMDFSGSMDDRAFPSEREYKKSKASVVASALKTSIPKIKRMNKADKAYVALIGFTEDAKLLGIFKASEVSDSIEYWDKWFEDNMSDVRHSYGEGTNITSALKLGRQIYDGALKGDLSAFGIYDFKPMYQDIVIGSNVYSVANVRVFIYSDGGHNSDRTAFTNYFEGASLIPGRTNVTGLTSAFLGASETDGYETMEAIAGVCPNHEVKAVIHVDKSKYYDYLRELFHMTSSTSGFCVECAKRGKSLNLDKKE